MGLAHLRGALALVAGLALLGATGGTALAADQSATDNPATDKLPGVLQKAVKSGQVDVIKSFPTDVPGLTGYVLEQSGQHQVVYGNHGYLVVGRIVGPDGTNMSDQYEQKYVPKPDLGKIVDQLKDGDRLVQQGPDDAPVVYVFADPNCIYCHRFYEQAEPLVKAGKIQLQWAMVGFLKDSSPGRAAAILSAKNPVKALLENENGFDESTEQGGIKPATDISDDLQQQLKAHAKLMAEAGGSGTPTLIYKEDGQWQSKIGAPGTDWLKTHVVNDKP
ncbi:thiol:disulfide interchange protein DsbG [Salinisphaera sp. Q1T1-3]|uniref:thiol:disulfide interchange protein DsbG n=1 Tax=Salinisphaera sp. Q1T1-3 TaxID=2321229 RepID=UPI000E70A687|nr:thiol:disulfide interchange protein DsbG [Salinisphaera sp. Q1T1-3]RJS91605.1 thiol:disulfide interchange protein DsbG [Salinisphaera sp. Q1T1-3]